ncbi:hypothetical protein AWN76_004050 [Rhodothermaceae bacterium RA]|nr:hypothetical protein AWN76_004050 [Rhodothermaceae bacterium RA]
MVMKKLTYTGLILALVVALGAAGTALAQPTKYAQAGMPFLKIDVGSRIAAMGGAHASVQGSANDMFSNPAGLAFLDGVDASFTTTSWIADISHYGLGVAFRAGNIGTFGFSYIFMDYGDFVRTVPYTGTDPALRNQGYLTNGTFSVNEYAIGLSYARQITGQFYVGGHFRYASQDLGNIVIFDQVRGTEVDQENQVNNLVFDFGTMYYTGFRDLRFGMSIRNFSNQSDYYDQRFELPLTFDFGVAMDLLSLAANPPGGENSALTVALDWQHPRDYEERLHLGLEYGFMDMVFLRGGYKFNYDEEGLTAGIGVKLGLAGYGIKAEYAYSDFGDFFGNVNRITLGVFGLQE